MSKPPQPIDQKDTGVSNGDVDWLFRGKIKKHGKGANQEGADQKLKAPKAPVIPSPSDSTSIDPSKQQQQQQPQQQSQPPSQPPLRKLSVLKSAQPPHQQQQVQPPSPQSHALNLQAGQHPEAQSAHLQHQQHSIPLRRQDSLSGKASHSVPSSATPAENQALHAANAPKSAPISGGASLAQPSAASQKLPTLRSASGLSAVHNSGHANESSTVAREPSLTLGLSRNLSKNRSRSSSISSTLTRKSLDSNDPQLKRRASTSSDTKPLQTIPSNEAEKNGGKKSLFSSLSSKFGKKKALAPPPHNSAQAPPQTNGTAATMNNNYFNSTGHAPIVGAPSGSSIPPGGQTNASLDASLESKKRFGSLRGKVSAKIANTSSKTVQPPAPTERVILNKNPNKVKIPIEELGNLKMRRVIFDINDLKFDPPQQIPSRKPKKGNVLIPEDIVGEVPRVSVGIANSDKKVVDVGPSGDFDQTEYMLAVDSQKRALEEAKKHANEAHMAALRIATEVANFKQSKNGHIAPNTLSAEEEEVGVLEGEPFHAGGVDIDKPMHHHEHHFEDDKPDEGGSSDSLETDDVPLDLLYTRCCHLREILPIPATLKQLKGKSKPLHVLKFLNPKPTLIDILSFSDFIAIAPINTIIFDNVILTNEMIKVVLSSLANNKSLEKLSLKNLMIDSEAWKYLCKFLIRNTNLLRLDLSQTKYRSDLKPEYYRFNMNWNLFVDVLKKRDGISELILTGIDFKFEDFQLLIEQGISISTKRLGLASSNISPQKIEIINSWLNKPNSTCEGIDLGFNDLSNKQLSKIKISNSNSKLLFLSLNSTNLSDIKELSACLKNLSELPNLSYLDLSSLTNIFPQIIPYLKRYLPKFPNLKRIHLDYNNLPAKSLAAILDILQMCKKLIHVSLIGNDVQGVAASLYGCVKASRSIFNVDIDYDSLPELISSKIAVVLMRNMEINLHGEDAVTKTEGGYDLEDELIFDGSLIAESAEAFLKTKTSDYEDYSNRLLKKSLINKTKVIRGEIHETIDALFVKRNNGELTIEGKERLLRFCLLDSALEKIVHIFESTDDSPVKAALSRENTGNDAASVLTAATTGDHGANAGGVQTSNLTQADNVAQAGLSFSVPQFEEEYMHNLSKDLINTNETISPELNQIQSSEIQYLNPQQALSGFNQVELPHQLAIEKSTDGKEISVDTTTGRPVLFRNISQTSINAKRQEEEEGELHKWGFFVQQHKQLYPDESNVPISPFPGASGALSERGNNQVAPEEQPVDGAAAAPPPANSNTKLQLTLQNKPVGSLKTSLAPPSKNNPPSTVGAHTLGSTSTLGSGVATPSTVTPKLLSLITGEQLRKAVMKAKGINSINDLIDKVEHNSLNLDNIYKAPTEYQENVPAASDKQMQPKNNDELRPVNTELHENLHGAASGAAATILTSGSPPAVQKQPSPEDTNVGDHVSIEDHDDLESFKSIDSMTHKVNDLTFEDDEEQKAVDETYDKLINEIVKVRSNK